MRLTTKTVEEFLRGYLTPTPENERLLACVLAHRPSLAVLDAQTERYIGQAEDPGSDESREQALGFALSALVECHEGPHNDDCPDNPGPIVAEDPLAGSAIVVVGYGHTISGAATQLEDRVGPVYSKKAAQAIVDEMNESNRYRDVEVEWVRSAKDWREDRGW